MGLQHRLKSTTAESTKSFHDRESNSENSSNFTLSTRTHLQSHRDTALAQLAGFSENYKDGTIGKASLDLELEVLYNQSHQFLALHRFGCAVPVNQD